jgi:heme a synthase
MFILQLALIGFCLALLPLSYIWVQADANKFRRLVWLTTFLTFDLILFGSFTRLTDSGLGCPDWPGCYGAASPFGAHEAIQLAQAALPTGPVTVVKAWIEMAHRYFAMAIGVLIAAQALIAWVRRRHLPISPYWPTALLGLVCVQGAFGAWTVTLQLQPAIVTLHLLLGLLLFVSLAWLAVRQTPMPAMASDALRWRPRVWLGLGLLVIQIALGGWVSANYAVMACTDFPTCNGYLAPPMNFSEGFYPWRELGKNGQGEFISQQALVAIHWTHRVFAVAVVAYLAWFAWCLLHFLALRRLAYMVLALLVVQCLTGLSNIVLQQPLLIAVAHNGGAALLLLLLVMIHCRISNQPARRCVRLPGLMQTCPGKAY